MILNMPLHSNENTINDELCHNIFETMLTIWTHYKADLGRWWVICLLVVSGVPRQVQIL